MFFINDINQIDEQKVLKKIQENAHFSVTYLTLLISSSVVTTLGLLQDSAPVVIGGMIISPLMWPLMKISMAVAYEKKSYLQEAFWMLLISIAMIVFSSIIVTYISPIKGINTQILIRTNPTLLDTIIALIGGLVASLALVQPKISESLAGVAMATSLMPPVCIVGICMALSVYNLALGSFILFFANVAAIVFISVLVFTTIGIKRETNSHLKERGIVISSIILIITAIPLFFFMRTYAFRITTQTQIENILVDQLKDISPLVKLRDLNLRFENSLNTGENIVFVDIDLDIPQDVSLNLKEREELSEVLKKRTNQNIDLNLRLSKIISIAGDKDAAKQQLKESIKTNLIAELEEINSTFSVESVEITENKDQNSKIQAKWLASMTVYGDPSTTFTYQDRENLEKSVNKNLGENISLDMSIVSLVSLKSVEQEAQKENRQNTQKAIQKTFGTLGQNVEVSGIVIQEKDNTIEINVEVKAPEAVEIGEETLKKVKERVQVDFENKQVSLQVNLINKKTLRLDAEMESESRIESKIESKTESKTDLNQNMEAV